MNLLMSIDQSLNSTGIIIWKDKPMWFLIKPTKEHKTDEAIHKIRNVIKELKSLVLEHGIDVIVIESLPYGVNSTSVRPLAALYYCIHNLCLDMGIEFHEANVTAVKKFATGSGKADKAQMINAAVVDAGPMFKTILDAGIKKTTGLGDLSDAYFIGQYFRSKNDIS